MTLIKEINDLRGELKNSRTEVHDLEASINILRKQGMCKRTLGMDRKILRWPEAGGLKFLSKSEIGVVINT